MIGRYEIRKIVIERESGSDRPRDIMPAVERLMK